MLHCQKASRTKGLEKRKGYKINYGSEHKSLDGGVGATDTIGSTVAVSREKNRRKKIFSLTCASLEGF